MTTQTQFTPGPWLQNRCTFRSLISTEDRPEVAIAEVFHVESESPADNHWLKAGEEGLANARLIASAPSLYAALKKMVEAYDALRETTGYREIGTSDCTAGAWLETQFGGISAHAPINMAREALAMGSGGGLGSSTPR